MAIASKLQRTRASSQKERLSLIRSVASRAKCCADDARKGMEQLDDEVRKDAVPKMQVTSGWGWVVDRSTAFARSAASFAPIFLAFSAMHRVSAARSLIDRAVDWISLYRPMIST